MDKYDAAVEYLTARPHQIQSAWISAWLDPDFEGGGCLFGFIRPSRDRKVGPDGRSYGCLTQIRNRPDWFCALTPEMTDQIVADDRIPTSDDQITVEMLPVFAEWQRKKDDMLDRGEY